MNTSGAVIIGQQTLPVNAQRIAEIIADYDPQLSLRWVPPENRTAFDLKPFAVYHSPVGLPEYPVMFLDETELDERVLASLFRANMATTDPLAELAAMEKAKEVLKAKARLEQQEEQAEFSRWAIKATKTVKHNGVKYE